MMWRGRAIPLCVSNGNPRGFRARGVTRRHPPLNLRVYHVDAIPFNLITFAGRFFVRVIGRSERLRSAANARQVIPTLLCIKSEGRLNKGEYRSWRRFFFC